MKIMALTTLAVLSLASGNAFAQGMPPGTDPGAAPQAFPNAPYHTGTVFSELYRGVFGHSKTDVGAADRTAGRDTASASGS
jgi:hypothetical protein